MSRLGVLAEGEELSSNPLQLVFQRLRNNTGYRGCCLENLGSGCGSLRRLMMSCLDSRLVFYFLPVVGAAVPDFDLATASGTVLLAATVFFLPAFGFLASRLLLF